MPLFTSEYVFSDDYPTIEPSLKLDFANARALDPRITFTRASTATYVGANGLIKTAGVDEARFDHDPATGESLGLLIEESRTNLLLRSEEFGTSWVQDANSVRTTNVAYAPSGFETADKFAVGTSTFPQITQNVTSTPSLTKSFSVYIKADGVNFIQLRVRNQGATTNFFRAIFNLTTGAVTSAIPNGTGTIVSSTAVNAGDGWWRCSITGIADTTGTTTQVLVILMADADGTVATPSNSAATDGVLLWGAQLEEGSFPTSYIPTSGSTATRAVEYGYTSNMDFYNQSEGSVFSEVSLLDVGNTGGKVIWSLNRVGAFGEGIYMVNENSSPTLAFNLFQGSSNQAAKATTNIIANQYYKTIYSFEKNNVNIGYGGAIGTDDTSATLPTIGRLVIGNNGWGSSTPSNNLNPGNCHIKSFSYYPKRLTNAQLQTLTQ